MFFRDRNIPKLTGNLQIEIIDLAHIGIIGTKTREPITGRNKEMAK